MSFRSLLNLMVTPYEYMNDWLRAIKWSKASPLCPKEKQLHYDIILLAHTVEKGLSVSNTRAGFGKQKINQLLSFLEQYQDTWDLFALQKAYGCLLSYADWHASIDYDLGAVGKNIEVFLRRCSALGLEPKGGVKHINNRANQPNEIYQQALNSRFSCRRFEPELISASDIDKIAEIAARTPSQCNRQSARVHYFSDRIKIDELLRLQGGSEGFRESVYNLFVISSEISAWSGVKARSQSYVDGSLAAMQVLNACQSLGLGACPLNLAVTNSREKKICKVGGISTGERLIMMIAFGIPEKVDLSVARSERISPETVLVRH